MNKLRILDMRANRLSNLNELQILTGFTHLEEVLFDVGKGNNPFCANKSEYYRMLIKHLRPTVKVLSL